MFTTEDQEKIVRNFLRSGRKQQIGTNLEGVPRDSIFVGARYVIVLE